MTRGACNGQDAAETGEGGTGGSWAALYEREAELAELSQALAEARDGTGGLVVIEGPAGIGKSRLLAETRTAAFAQGMAVLTARGTDLERDAPFGVASELLAAVLAAPRGTGRARPLSGQASLAAPLFRPGRSACGGPLGPGPRPVLADGRCRMRSAERRGSSRAVVDRHRDRRIALIVGIAQDDWVWLNAFTPRQFSARCDHPCRTRA